jgi:U2 small nuclear ribonucleoprotein A'
MFSQDQYDVLDFSDNEIKKLENFPRCTRLTTLLLSNNRISRISSNIHEQIVNLETLIMTNNRIENLSEIDNLVGCKKLTSLCLLSNPVVRRQHYRLYVIHKLPSVKVVDFCKVKEAERKQAERLFRSAAGKLMAADVEAEAKNFTPDEAEDDVMAGFSAEQREQVCLMNQCLLSFCNRSLVCVYIKWNQIQAAIASAGTLEDVDRIERQLKAGIVPSVKKAAASAPASVPPPPAQVPSPAPVSVLPPAPPAVVAQVAAVEEEEEAEETSESASASAMDESADNNSGAISEADVSNGFFFLFCAYYLHVIFFWYITGEENESCRAQSRMREKRFRCLRLKEGTYR